MHKLLICLAALAALNPATALSKSLPKLDSKAAVMFDLRLDKGQASEDLKLNGAASLVSGGLELKAGEDLVKLDRFYALAERAVRYRIRPSSDAVLHFQSDLGDFHAYVDVPSQKISIGTSPATVGEVPFLAGGREYDVEVYHIYNKAIVRIKDVKSGAEAEISAVHDGQGGCGRGAVQQGFAVGLQWDRYCFGLASGTSATVSRITVLALKKKVKLLIYGDSITQPEGYFPAAEFHDAWTQRVIAQLDGDAMSSGRGGCNINDLLVFIRNELPYVKCRYVMVTIGTNGGNTEENLSTLVEYIMSQGRIPILNNVPSNESGSQVPINELVVKIRQKYGIKGCLFDLPTSIAGDGKEVDKSTMWFEDLWEAYRWLVYHHPNSRGAALMFNRTLQDVPEIYKQP